jgi:hypothetical protein
MHGHPNVKYVKIVQKILPSRVNGLNYQMTVFWVDVTVVEEHAGLHLQRDRIVFRQMLS